MSHRILPQGAIRITPEIAVLAVLDERQPPGSRAGIVAPGLRPPPSAAR